MTPPDLTQFYPCRACHQPYASHLPKEPQKCLFGSSVWTPADLTQVDPKEHAAAIPALLWQVKVSSIGEPEDIEEANQRFLAQVQAIRELCPHPIKHPQALNLCGYCGAVRLP